MTNDIIDNLAIRIVLHTTGVTVILFDKGYLLVEKLSSGNVDFVFKGHVTDVLISKSLHYVTMDTVKEYVRRANKLFGNFYNVVHSG